MAGTLENPTGRKADAKIAELMAKTMIDSGARGDPLIAGAAFDRVEQ